MNAWHVTILAAAAVYVALRLARRKAAAVYARYLLLAVASGLVLSPFVWLVCSAFKDKDVLMQFTFLPPVRDWSPDTLNLQNFRDLFSGQQTAQGTVYFWEYIVNSLFLAGAGTLIPLFFCSLGGYALAKYRFRAKKPLMAFMLATMMMPGMLFLAPVYRMIYQLGWMDTYWALLVPGAVSVFGMFLFRQAITAVPDSLIEAARMDGAGEFGIYLHVVMPLVRPMSAAFCLIAFLGAWNAFIGPQVFLQTQSKLTLPVVLNQSLGLYVQHYGTYMAGTLLAIIPPAVLFFALQKEFVAGLTSGAVKG